MQDAKTPGSPNDFLANERTFLAWIRTSIGIMAFGFVVEKFSLFVKQMTLIIGSEQIVQPTGNSDSALIGILLVTSGAFTIILSYIRYRLTEKRLREGVYTHSSLFLTIITAFIFLMSILLIAYLTKSI